MKIDVLMLDLGNVLIDLHIDKFKKEAEKRLKRKIELGNDPLHHLYMAGQFDEDSMRTLIQSEYGLQIEREEFQEFWSLMIGPDREEIYPLLDQLRDKMKLALCSNTDETHIHYLRRTGSRMIKNFDYCVFSFEIGFTKPHPEYFKAALNIVNAPAKRCLFLDDGLENVEAAKEMGINAIHTPTKESVINALKDLLK